MFKRLLCIAVLALSGCAAADALEPPAATVASGWEQVSPPAIRSDGRIIRATCSGAPETDPAFAFWLRRADPARLVIYFDGGGACWDDITCAVPRRAADRREDDGFYKAELIDADLPQNFSGIFDFSNPRNPLRGWTFVFVPYCTGDVHTGANTAHYTDPDTGAPYTIEHRGADNFRTVLAWIERNLPAPAELLVAGSSAGAYGATTHYPRIREAFPRARVMLMGDAGQGVTTQDFLERRELSWRAVAPLGLFGGREHVTVEDDIVARLAERYPDDRFAQYTTARDITQSSFYALMGVPHACRAWTVAMTQRLTERQRAANFRSYLAAGDTHTILRSPRFYTEQSGGAPFAEWFAAMLGGGQGWDNRHCEDCLAPPTHCSY